MARLIIRNLEDEVVRRLREEAAREGVSVEEKVRRILRGTLLKEKPDISFKEYLLTMPCVEDDSIFERRPSEPRTVQFETANEREKTRMALLKSRVRVGL